MDKTLARDLVNALRNGTVPAYGLRELAVGIDEHLSALAEQLDYVAGGATAVRFIEGGYGSGKTFLCSLLREEALARGFAATFVVVSPDAPLGKLDVVYSRLMDGMRTSVKRTSTALADILEKWLLREYRRARDIVGAESPRSVHDHVLSQVEHKLRAISDVAPGLAAAIKAYYEASRDRDMALTRGAAAWLRGSRAVPRDVCKRIGVRGAIGDEDLYAALRAVALVVREAGYEGLLVIIDEVETIQRLSHRRQRDDAYEVLRVLVDGTGENRYPGCLFVFTGTEQLFQDPIQGMKSYEALAARIERPETFSGHTTSRQPILQLTGLRRDDLAEAARRVRGIHAIAYDWPAPDSVSDSYLEDLARRVTDSFGESIERLPRGFLREVVHLCDAAQEHSLRYESADTDLIGVSIGARLEEDMHEHARLEDR